MATIKRARLQPEIGKQEAKEPAAHKSARSYYPVLLQLHTTTILSLTTPGL
jgi:hypothetical protein